MVGRCLYATLFLVATFFALTVAHGDNSNGSPKAAFLHEHDSNAGMQEIADAAARAKLSEEKTALRNNSTKSNSNSTALPVKRLRRLQNTKHALAAIALLALAFGAAVFGTAEYLRNTDEQAGVPGTGIEQRRGSRKGYVEV
jgi:hypothetical protein